MTTLGAASAMDIENEGWGGWGFGRAAQGMTVISCYSIKGGVGKTALAVNLSYKLQRDGRRTLLVDLDPQGASAFYFRVAPASKFKVRDGGLAEAGLRENIRESDYPDLDILPSNMAYRKLDVLLGRLKKSRNQLRHFLKTLSDQYSVVVLDCPPNITLLSENVFRASDAILVPVIPTLLSRRTLEQLVEFFREKDLPSERIVPFFSMVQARKRLHHSTMEELRAENPSILETVIPFSVDVENMGIDRQPVLASAPGRPASLAYEALCAEIVERTRAGK
jgi:chromosome partitioning protein